MRTFPTPKLAEIPLFERRLLAVLIFLGIALAVRAGDADVDAAVRVVAVAAGEEVAPGDVRVTRARQWIAQTMKATGETDARTVAAACVRLSRHLFDVTKQRISPLEVLEALATRAPPGRPLQETTQRYFDLRAKQKLDHTAALAAMQP